MDKEKQERYDAEEAIESADEGLREALLKRHEAGNHAAILAYRRLMSWQPEVGFPKRIRPAYSYSRSGGQHAEFRREIKGAPFMTEAYLYELLGKEDARTLLALMHTLARSLVGEDYRMLDRDA